MTGYNGDQVVSCKRPRIDGVSLESNDDAGLRLRRQVSYIDYLYLNKGIIFITLTLKYLSKHFILDKI